MKILIVGKVPTHPVRMGNSRLIADQAVFLQSMGHEVHYLYIHEVRRRERSKDVTPRAFADMFNFWGDRFHLLKISKIRHLFLITRSAIKYRFNNGYIHPDDHYSNIIHEEINQLDAIHHFDCCMVNYYYLSKALENISIPRKALVTHDIFTYRDKICNFKVPDSLTPNHEAMAVQRAKYILNVQEEDSIYFRKLAPKSKVLTTYASFTYTPTEYIGNHGILFLSGNSSFNYNGIIWFIDKVLPLLVEKYSDVQLIIGGGICSALKEYEANPNIKLLGSIDSPIEFFNNGDIFINPTYQGTGLKIKTFEGIAYDKVVIANSHSRVGIFNPHNAPILFPETPDDWVHEISSIFESKAKVIDIKLKDREYLTQMNKFIKSQYTYIFE